MKSLSSPMLAHLPDHSFIFIVTADPGPDEVRIILDSKSPVFETDSERPELAHPFEMQGGMPRIFL